MLPVQAHTEQYEHVLFEHSYIVQTNHNVIEDEKGETPAMREKLTTKIWSWKDVFKWD